MSQAPREWHLITGEYPPTPGGVSDYTALLANGLASRGCTVHVWCPTLPDRPGAVSGVVIHEIPGGFSFSGLRWLGRSLRQFEHPKTLFVQYVYNAYGFRGMNLAFCGWLLSRSWLWRDDVRVMFHEPYFPFGWQSFRRNALAGVTHAMAALMLAAGRTVYLSAAAWEPLLRPWNLLRRRTAWLPIPSTIPGVEFRPSESQGLERSLTLGHFGTYGGPIREPLLHILTGVLAQQRDVHLKLLGGGGKQFALELIQRTPELAPRVTAFDRLPDNEVAQHIRSCDVMLQYYPDGVSTRRTSAMACLANGVPVVTTTGRLSEPLWASENAVAVAPAGDVNAVVATAVNVLNDPKEQLRLATCGFDFYHHTFSWNRTLDALLGAEFRPLNRTQQT